MNMLNAAADAVGLLLVVVVGAGDACCAKHRGLLLSWKLQGKVPLQDGRCRALQQ